MIDVKALDQRIRDSGLKRIKIASSLGITLAALKKKTNGKREFKASEIQILCRLLDVEVPEEMERIFFA